MHLRKEHTQFIDVHNILKHQLPGILIHKNYHIFTIREYYQREDILYMTVQMSLTKPRPIQKQHIVKS